jgi:glycerol kinase
VTDLLWPWRTISANPLARMRVDGGAAANDLLMQLQADFAAMAIERPFELESTARGAAMLAAVGAGLFRDKAEASGMSPVERTFTASPRRQPRSAAPQPAGRARWRSRDLAAGSVAAG